MDTHKLGAYIIYYNTIQFITFFFTSFDGLLQHFKIF